MSASFGWLFLACVQVPKNMSGMHKQPRSSQFFESAFISFHSDDLFQIVTKVQHAKFLSANLVKGIAIQSPSSLAESIGWCRTTRSFLVWIWAIVIGTWNVFQQGCTGSISSFQTWSKFHIKLVAARTHERQYGMSAKMFYCLDCGADQTLQQLWQQHESRHFLSLPTAALLSHEGPSSWVESNPCMSQRIPTARHRWLNKSICYRVLASKSSASEAVGCGFGHLLGSTIKSISARPSYLSIIASGSPFNGMSIPDVTPKSHLTSFTLNLFHSLFDCRALCCDAAWHCVLRLSKRWVGVQPKDMFSSHNLETALVFSTTWEPACSALRSALRFESSASSFKRRTCARASW